MGPDMKRREFIISLAGTAAVWPLAATAQKAPTRIGWLSSGSEKSAVGLGFVADIKDGLRENGMIEGRDYVLEARYADGVYERFPDLVRELVQARVAIIVTNTIASVRAAQRITPPVPIVMCPINDPVGNGLIASLARPGGMTTGVATLNEDLTAKMLEFQRTVIPAVRTIAAIYNPGNPSNVQALEGIRTRALEMGINVLPIPLRSPQELEAALATVASARPDSLQIIADSGTLDMTDRIAAFAKAQRLPSFSTQGNYAEIGGLLAYGAPRRKLVMKAGFYIKRILDGANPGELPVQQPTQIELSINMKIATALGIAVPASLQQLADNLIE
jgi:putative ABC transport system substrate-binding protein